MNSMSIDELQSAWRSQETRTTVSVVMLLEDVRKKQRRSRRVLFWRNLREGWLTVLAGLYFALFVETDVASKLQLWPFYLAMTVVCGVGVFRVVSTRRQLRRGRKHGEACTSFIARSLGEINHRIWLLESILWWWILPFSGVCILIGAQIILLGGLQDPTLVPKVILGVGVIFAVFAGVYWGNLWTARKYWRPRRDELQGLLNSLEEVDP